MTNYNERLDEILMGVWHTGYNRCNMEKNHADGYDNYAFAIAPKKAKQAITSLIKELVAEARIDELQMIETAQQNSDQWGNFCIDDTSDFSNYIGSRISELEQNLLKALEEV